MISIVDTVLVPRLSNPDIPERLERGVTALGLNRAKVAILVALAQEGGSAETPRLHAITGLARTILLRYLKGLEMDGYVSGVPGPEGRRPGVRIQWTTRYDQLEADLLALLASLRPAVQ